MGKHMDKGAEHMDKGAEMGVRNVTAISGESLTSGVQGKFVLFLLFFAILFSFSEPGKSETRVNYKGTFTKQERQHKPKRKNTIWSIAGSNGAASKETQSSSQEGHSTQLFERLSYETNGDDDRVQRIANRIAAQNAYIGFKIKVEILGETQRKCEQRNLLEQIIANAFFENSKGLFVGLHLQQGQVNAGIDSSKLALVPIIVESDKASDCTTAIFASGRILPRQLYSGDPTVGVRVVVRTKKGVSANAFETLSGVATTLAPVITGSKVITVFADEKIKQAGRSINEKISSWAKLEVSNPVNMDWNIMSHKGIAFVVKDKDRRSLYKITIIHEAILSLFGKTPTPQASRDFRPVYTDIEPSSILAQDVYTDNDDIRRSVDHFLRNDAKASVKLVIDSSDATNWPTLCSALRTEITSKLRLNGFDTAVLIYPTLLGSKYGIDETFSARGCPDRRFFQLLHELGFADLRVPATPSAQLEAQKEARRKAVIDAIAGNANDSLLSRFGAAGKSENRQASDFGNLWAESAPKQAGSTNARPSILFDRAGVFGSEPVEYEGLAKITETLSSTQLLGIGCFSAQKREDGAPEMNGLVLGVAKAAKPKLFYAVFHTEVPTGATFSRSSARIYEMLTEAMDPADSGHRNLFSDAANRQKPNRGSACCTMITKYFADFGPKCRVRAPTITRGSRSTEPAS